jgi:hypothetical protein
MALFLPAEMLQNFVILEKSGWQLPRPFAMDADPYSLRKAFHPAPGY